MPSGGFWPCCFPALWGFECFFTFSIDGTGCEAGPGSKSYVSISVLVYKVSQYSRHLSNMSALSFSVRPSWAKITFTLGHVFFVRQSTVWNESFDLFFAKFFQFLAIPFKWSVRYCLSCARTCHFSCLYHGPFLRQLRFSSIRAKVSGLIHFFFTVQTCFHKVFSAVSVVTAFSCCHFSLASIQFDESATSGVSNSCNVFCSSSWNFFFWEKS